MSGTGIASNMVSGICSMIAPFMGSNSQVLSLVFLISLATMLFLWWMNESKEGIIVWVLRTGLALAVLINIFTLPAVVGLPGVCG